MANKGYLSTVFNDLSVAQSDAAMRLRIDRDKTKIEMDRLVIKMNKMDADLRDCRERIRFQNATITSLKAEKQNDAMVIKNLNDTLVCSAMSFEMALDKAKKDAPKTSFNEEELTRFIYRVCSAFKNGVKEGLVPISLDGAGERGRDEDTDEEGGPCCVTVNSM